MKLKLKRHPNTADSIPSQGLSNSHHEISAHCSLHVKSDIQPHQAMTGTNVCILVLCGVKVKEVLAHEAALLVYKRHFQSRLLAAPGV